MINTYICAMGSGVKDTNIFIDTHAPTDAISLDLLMDLSVLVLQGIVVDIDNIHIQEEYKRPNALLGNHW